MWDIIFKCRKQYQYPIVVDLEGDSLFPSKFHCMGWYDFKTGVQSTTDPEVMKEVLSKADLVIGHNFWLWDQFHVKRLLGDYTYDIIDTLALSNYLHNRRVEHSLESYEAEAGVKKVQVEDWQGSSIELYLQRVEEDVKLNTNILYLFLKLAKELYGENIEAIMSAIRLVTFQYECYHWYRYNPFTIDLERVEKYITELEGLRDFTRSELMKKMPNIMETKFPPAKLRKKDGTLSEQGKKWFLLLEENGAALDSESVEVIKEGPNPDSSEQLKSWLFSLGWEPKTFKDGANGPVPQLKDKDGNLCYSVTGLGDSSIPLLEDYAVINHRLAHYLYKFREIEAYADIKGLTNTLRIKHRNLVNLPKISKKFGEYVRGCLTCKEDEIIIGSDLSSLENYTRTNLICNIDPSSITDLLDPEFDTHLDMAVYAGMCSEEDVAWFKNENKEIEAADKEGRTYEISDIKRYKLIKEIRGQAKQTNYSALYSVGAKKLAKDLGISLKKAQTLLDGYWKKNFAVKKFSAACKIKEVNREKWVQAPYNGVWLPLRNMKDIFSTLNQSFGSYVFTLWKREIMNDLGHGYLAAEFHDEIAVICKKDEEEKVRKAIPEALERVNEFLKLKVPIRCEVHVGKYYSEVH